MTQEQINELRKLADPLVPWCVNHAKESAYGTAVIGHVDEDDNMHEVACFDLTMYDGFEGDSLKMAQYYAAANPATILALIAEIDRTKRMFAESVSALAAIDAAMGVPEDGCNSTDKTITAIKLLHAVSDDDEKEIARITKQRDELLRIASDAATSLETIHIRSFGDDSYLNHPDQMRAYAGSRAGVVRKELKDAGIES